MRAVGNFPALDKKFTGEYNINGRREGEIWRRGLRLKMRLFWVSMK